MKLSTTSCAFLVGTLLAQPHAVVAQDTRLSDRAENPGGNVAETSDDVVLDDQTIVVTAQRREERLQDVPISIAVVSGDALQDRAIENFEDLAPLVPNLTVAKTPAANLIILRGIGSGAGSPSLDQSVVMFIDGIYAGNARQFATPFLDVERLEILRGPQGALVGRNTSAGAINILSRRPGKDLGGYLLANYNFDYDGPTIEGGVDLPVADFLHLRAVGKYGDVDGYIYNPLLDQYQPTRRDMVGRLVGVIDDDGPVVVTFKYEHASINIEGNPTQVFAPKANQFRDYIKSTKLLDGAEYDDIETDNGMVRFDIELGGPSLTLISGYSAFSNKQIVDADFFEANFATADFDQDFEQFSQEARLSSDVGEKISYIVGAYYSISELNEQRTTGVLFAPPASTFRTFDQDDEVYSVFGQLSWRLSERLRISGGARYTHQTKTAQYRRFAGPLAASDRVGTLVADFGGRIADGRIDPSLSVQYEFNRNIMMYGSFSRGSKSSGFQGAISNATKDSFEYRPELSTSYEVGARFLLPRRGFFNLAAFHTTYRDLQVSAGIATPGSLQAAFFTGNAPEARIVGLETEFAYQITPEFRIDGSARP